eukprot:3941998-Rhodomonas_salina.2
MKIWPGLRRPVPDMAQKDTMCQDWTWSRKIRYASMGQAFEFAPRDQRQFGALRYKLYAPRG